ncbi:MAG: hypothetical protein EXQ96_06475 [Alphaproteobacteria bacterium]|nr:hypothetical protein [Alphaproteobacteria bacterium]
MPGLRQHAAGVVAVAALLLGAPAAAQLLTADLADHLVAIDTGFTGGKVLLYGAIEPPGDVVVVVRGPAEEHVVRRKQRTLGIWINRDQMIFDNVPAFYAVASSRPLPQLGAERAFGSNEIGLENLRLRPAEAGRTEADIQSFREGLIRNKERGGLYSRTAQPIQLIGDKLFSASFAFPANVAPGAYVVDVYLFRDGQVASAQTTPLHVSKIGIESQTSAFARRHAAWYGIIAVVVALLAGWLAGVVFSKK